jgi:hypothetical protein
MSWIKRNLLFVVGSVVALALLVGAGFYNFIGWRHNVEARDALNKAYDDLNSLKNLNPNPGQPNKVDNVKNAQDQQLEIRKVIANALQHFKPIRPIPDLPKIQTKDFTTALGDTIDRLQHEAAAASVSLPSAYSFSFQAQSRGVRFQIPSLQPLSVQVGEIAALCDVLIRSKINAIEGIRRERVASAPEEQTGPPTDYLDPGHQSQTNDLAVVTPYEMTFRCFSSELAAVLSGFANSPHCFIVKGINVEPAVLTGTAETPGMSAAPTPVMSVEPTVPLPPRRFSDPRRRFMPPTAPIYVPPPTRAPVPMATPSRAVLNEKELRVTMWVYVVKLAPRK